MTYNFELSDVLPATPQAIYDAWMSSESHRRQPSKVTAEYASPPEIAGTAAPGSALMMSSLGQWPPFDRWGP